MHKATTSRLLSPRQAFALAAIACLAAVVFTFPLMVISPDDVLARSAGIYGYSGAGSSGNGGGAICTACHSSTGDFDPSVEISGPVEVFAGSISDYTITVTEDSDEEPEFAGFCAAIGDGELDSEDNGVKSGGNVGEGELTHRGPRDFDSDDVVTWDITWEAPDEAGEYTLYVAANCANDNGSTTGDNIASTSLEITVIVPEPVFMRGDVNGNGIVDALTDGLRLLNYGFNEGAEPPCFDAADVNGNNDVDALTDALFLFRYGFTEGTVPPDPGPNECGLDPEDDEDEVDCVQPPDCN